MIAGEGVGVLAFVAVTMTSGVLSLLARRSLPASGLLGIGGLIAAAIVAASLEPWSRLVVGDSALVVSPFLREFLALGAVIGLGLSLVGLATSWPPDLPGAMLLGLGAAAVTLAAGDPVMAMTAAAAGGLIGLLVTLSRPRAPGSAAVAAREVRGVAVSAAVAIVAVAWLAHQPGGGVTSPMAGGRVLLGFGLAVALRFGAIPFHLWAARLPDVAPELSLPLVLAWGPAAFAVALTAVSSAALAPIGADLPIERAVVAAVGVLSIVLGTGAALLHDDLEHVVAYSIVADAGLVVLALSAVDPGADGRVRAYLLAFVVAKSAFAAWAAAIRGAFGTRRLRDLGGWVRRAPVLAAAIALIAGAGVGWPGLLVFESRARVLDLALPGPLAAAVLLAAVASLAYHVRIIVVGLRRPTAVVAAGASPVPTWPFRRRPATIGELRQELRPAWRANRAPAAAVVVAAMAALALLVSAGGLGAAGAASGSPAPAGPSATPSARPSASASFAPSAAPDGSALPSASSAAGAD